MRWFQCDSSFSHSNHQGFSGPQVLFSSTGTFSEILKDNQHFRNYKNYHFTCFTGSAAKIHSCSIQSTVLASFSLYFNHKTFQGDCKHVIMLGSIGIMASKSHARISVGFGASRSIVPPHIFIQHMNMLLFVPSSQLELVHLHY